MCYTIKSSIHAFVVNIVFCIILYMYANNKDNNKNSLKILAFFFLYVGVMQFWDILFWSYEEKHPYNSYATKMAMVWNHFEPIVLYLLILFITKKTDTISTITIVFYTLCMMLYTSCHWKQVKTTGLNDTGNSLYWKWNYMDGSVSFYALFLATLLLIIYRNFTGWIRNVSFALTLITFTFSAYKYQIDKSVGRFWCYFAAYLPILFAALSYIYDK